MESVEPLPEVNDPVVLGDWDFAKLVGVACNAADRPRGQAPGLGRGWKSGRPYHDRLGLSIGFIL